MATGHPLSDSPPLLSVGIWTEWERRRENGPRGGGNNRDIKQVYAKMSTKVKETLKLRMVDIDEAAIGDEENTPLSLTPM
jgi:hypothetical protein